MFLISFFLVILSSYFITSIVMEKEQKQNIGILYFFLVCFAQIVLTFEILSLCNSIKEIPFLTLNLLVLIGSTLLWLKKNKPVYKLEIKTELKKIIKAIKLDKILLVLSLFFIFCITIKFITSLIIYPARFGDAISYYLPRVITWIQNTNINHFITPDTRELIMPVNMDFLYAWVMLFLKKEIGISIFSYISFLGANYVIYNLLGELNFCIRKRLFAIFLFSSFCLISAMAITPCADLFIGTLLLTSIYLFLNYLKYNNKVSLYFSTLSCALAFGTKTTAIIAFPSICIIFFVLNYIYKKEDLTKNIIYYIVLVFINFIIFSSYNYVLNFLQYNNLISCPEQFLLNKFRGGIQGYLCNLTKYIFAFFDCSGIENIDFYNNFINNLQVKFFKLFSLTPESFTSPFFKGYFNLTDSREAIGAYLGAIGLLGFVPALFISIKNFCKNKINKRNIIIFALTFSFIINILLFSRVMTFTEFNLRYVVTFIVLASPILVTIYAKNNKNLFKWILTIFMIIYLFKIPLEENLFYISNSENFKTKEENQIFNYFINKKDIKIGLIATTRLASISDITKLKLHNFEIDKILVEEIENYNLDKYDYIITKENETLSSNVKSFDKFLNGESRISECKYLDYDNKEIRKGNVQQIASVSCIIPFNYLQNNNFKEINDLKLYEYRILKNTSHTNV